MKRSDKRMRRRKARAWFALVLCALVMLASLGYMLHYEHTRRAILRSNAEFSALYSAPEVLPPYLMTAAPGEATATPTAAPTATPTIVLTATPTIVPTATPTTIATASATPTAAPTPSPTPAPSPVPTVAAAVDATRAPRGTAGADTLVVAAQTPPPVQESFAELLAANPDAAGFLTIDGVLELPVVQRRNDNEFYLAHSFDGAESVGGTLFLDGANLLAPEDDCLIVYGHNMKNGTMFRPLVQYEQLAFLREHPLVRFDTLYENRVWAPFAALTVTAAPDSERYLNLRQFSFDEPGFEMFTRSLRTLSVWDSPIDVRYGDDLLLLVTCEYTHDDGRFVLALRAARTDESWDQLLAQVQKSK